MVNEWFYCVKSGLVCFFRNSKQLYFFLRQWCSSQCATTSQYIWFQSTIFSLFMSLSPDKQEPTMPTPKQIQYFCSFVLWDLLMRKRTHTLASHSCTQTKSLRRKNNIWAHVTGSAKRRNPSPAPFVFLFETQLNKINAILSSVFLLLFNLHQFEV